MACLVTLGILAYINIDVGERHRRDGGDNVGRWRGDKELNARE